LPTKTQGTNFHHTPTQGRTGPQYPKKKFNHGIFLDEKTIDKLRSMQVCRDELYDDILNRLIINHETFLQNKKELIERFSKELEEKDTLIAELREQLLTARIHKKGTLSHQVLNQFVIETVEKIDKLRSAGVDSMEILLAIEEWLKQRAKRSGENMGKRTITGLRSKHK